MTLIVLIWHQWWWHVSIRRRVVLAMEAVEGEDNADPGGFSFEEEPSSTRAPIL